MSLHEALCHPRMTLFRQPRLLVVHECNSHADVQKILLCMSLPLTPGSYSLSKPSSAMWFRKKRYNCPVWAEHTKVLCSLRLDYLWDTSYNNTWRLWWGLRAALACRYKDKCLGNSLVLWSLKKTIRVGSALECKGSSSPAHTYYLFVCLITMFITCFPT